MNTISVEELKNKFKQEQESKLGYKVPVLDTEFLLKRVRDGGQSGDFLARAFLSAYFHSPFSLSLGQITKIDSDGMRLFHEIMHIRHVSGWSDDEYYRIAVKIQALNGAGS